MKKPFWQSTTIQGIAAAMLAFLVKLAVVRGWLPVDMVDPIGELIGTIADIVQPGGMAYAIYGRLVTNGETLTLNK